MASKIKNNSSRYLTRAALAGASLGSTRGKALRPSEHEYAEAEQRDAKATLDSRWYIQLPPK